MDLVSWTFDSSVDDKDRPLLIDAADSSRSLSYNQLRSLVRRLVAGLRAAGIQEGDCVCVSSVNDLYYSVLFLGIIGAGAVYTGINPSYTAHEIVHHLRFTKPKLLLVQPEHLPNALSAAKEIQLPTSSIFAFDVATRSASVDVQSWNSLLQHGEADWTRPSDPGRTVAHYASTSGTSGLPKAARIPHAYHVTQAAARLTGDELPYEPRRLTPLPPFHVFATPIIPSSIRQGVTTYVMSRYDPQRFVECVQQFAITETYLPPPPLTGLAQNQHASRETLDSLRQIWYGGASIPYIHQLPIYALLNPEAKIQPVWGMTEVGWITAGTWTEKVADDSVGRMLPYLQAKVVDDEGNVIAEHGATGNIIVRSPCPMLGYIDNEPATNEMLDEQGWVHTGDIGFIEEGNKVTIVDRKKDLIKIHAWQVSPTEVESAITMHAAVADAAVIGVPIANGTDEIARAFIVLRPGHTVKADELRQFMSQSLARYKIPKQFVVVESIPKSPTGKILRRLLKEMNVELEEKPTVLDGSLKGNPKSPWRHVRDMSNGSIKTISSASKCIWRFLNWLKSLILVR